MGSQRKFRTGFWMAGAGLLLLLPACSHVLEEGLDQREANEILLVLSQAGIAAEKSGRGGDGGNWVVKVDRQDLTQSWSVLKAAGLPRRRHEGFRSVYRERGLVPGRMEEQALYLSALQEEIAQTLESIDGVVTARVHATVGAEARAGKADGVLPSASVLIGYRPGLHGELPIDQTGVQKIVSNALVGLAAERVAVVFCATRADPVAVASTGDGATAAGVVRLLAAGVAVLGLLFALAFGVLRGRLLFPFKWLRRAA